MMTKTVRIILAIALCVGPGLVTLAVGRGLWGVATSFSIDDETPNGGVGFRSHTDFYFYVATFVISVGVSVVGLVLLVRQLRRSGIPGS